MSAPVIIIAEAGVNHNGDVKCAFELIDRAAEAGVDYIKFQTFKSDKLASKFVEKAEYQKKLTQCDENQLTMLRKLELSFTDHEKIYKHCLHRGIKFLSTPFDSDSLDFLTKRLNLDTIKLGSGEITNGPILLQAAQTKAKLILSTGMSTLAEIETALAVIAYGCLNKDVPKSDTNFHDALHKPESWELLRNRVKLLQCTTEYPAPVEETNLRAMDTIKQAFGLEVGYSDHTKGRAITIAAVARGAQLIEKHFTLDRTLDGPDHAASVEPNELKKMVQEIRSVELALGNGIKHPGAHEIENRHSVRRSLVATRDLNAGDTLQGSDLVVKRPGNGIPGTDLWRTIGRTLVRDILQDEVIEFQDLL